MVKLAYKNCKNGQILNFSTESEKLKAQLESLQKECDEISKKYE